VYNRSTTGATQTLPSHAFTTPELSFLLNRSHVRTNQFDKRALTFTGYAWIAVCVLVVWLGPRPTTILLALLLSVPVFLALNPRRIRSRLPLFKSQNPLVVATGWLVVVATLAGGYAAAEALRPASDRLPAVDRLPVTNAVYLLPNTTSPVWLLTQLDQKETVARVVQNQKSKRDNADREYQALLSSGTIIELAKGTTIRVLDSDPVLSHVRVEDVRAAGREGWVLSFVLNPSTITKPTVAPTLIPTTVPTLVSTAVPTSVSAAKPTPGTLQEHLELLARTELRDDLRGVTVERINLTGLKRMGTLPSAGPVPTPVPQPGDQIVTGVTIAASGYDGLFSSSDTLFGTSIDHVARLAPVIFTQTDVNELVFETYLTFTDVYGNDSDKPAVTISLRRETASKINWPNFDAHNLERVLYANGDYVSVHPSLRKDWVAYQSNSY
jgi:hypothetical protein